ncbi:G-patch domain-containing protein [Artemisia annua]|uniref:G-patch domain-containing protein n=1 Tax=Artemisia annua TaxID=35608 RepID=A0A2U1NKE0_ARTAN|nr:G-patch domain-containing protein [Artemisia annua]
MLVRKEEVQETKSPKKSSETIIKATRPQGRYKRKEREKRANAYSAQDLEGILLWTYSLASLKSDYNSSLGLIIDTVMMMYPF